ncbi:hypothetical protein ODJ79_32590 [Actinoplanes sp. KI2]|uniref:hypothetical protein n=1 Tax=Actinoplanes sp. KI2 TaxID=2983315 RepID=UPI0021D578CD|nr:hypothetical protein [Actinoplanes sp. KI2]MCU7728474.1 hypothetical protein [Actinoplanes sp. KI2]
MSLVILGVNLFVFLVAMESDIGRRKISRFRVFRPVAAAVIIVPFFFKGLDLSGKGLLLELAGIALGIVMGLVALSFMRFEYDGGQKRVFTRAGLLYVLAWIAITAAKIFFSYGSSNLWSHEIGKFMYENQISVDAFRDTIIFLNVATIGTRAAVIYVRGRGTATANGQQRLFVRGSKTRSPKSKQLV